MTSSIIDLSNYIIPQTVVYVETKPISSQFLHLCMGSRIREKLRIYAFVNLRKNNKKK